MVLAVGIPMEIKTGECRVSLTPHGVRTLSEHGIPIYVEQKAGERSGFSDQEYEQAGARLVGERKELWQKAALIKKVKEPVIEEFELFESRHIIFTYLHLASPSARPLIDALLRAQATAIGYETVVQKGETPLLKPMSEVAGVLAAYFAGIFRNYVRIEGSRILGLERAKSLMGELASTYPVIPKNIPLGQVMILGGGEVGEKAARMSSAMGGTVFLSEISHSRRNQLKREFNSTGLKIHLIHPDDTTRYETCLASSEVIIAAVHRAGKRAPLVIGSGLLKRISEKETKIILDIAIDQGGNIAQSHASDYEHPIYVDSFGNLRFSVTNIPSLCGRGASLALEEVSLDYTRALASGVEEAIKRYPEFKSGVNILRGRLVHPAVREAHQLD